MMVLVSIGTVMAVYCVGRLLFDHKTGVIASLVLSIIPSFSMHSHFMVNSVPVAFFSTLVFLCAIWIYRSGGTLRAYLLAGFLIGPVIAERPPAALIVLVPLFAHLHLHRLDKKRKLGVFGFTIPISFLLCAPTYLVDFHNTIQAVQSYSASDLSPAQGATHILSSTWQILLAFTTSSSLPVALYLALAFAFLLHKIRSSRDFPSRLLVVWMVSTFPIVLINTGVFVRYMIPLLPPLALAAARLTLCALERQQGRSVLKFALLGLGGLVLIVGLGYSLHIGLTMSSGTIQEQVSDWVVKHVPVESRVAVDLPIGYRDPVLDNTLYQLQSLSGIDCNEVPDYAITLTGRLPQPSVGRLHYNLQIQLSNIPQLPLLIPTEWQAGDWIYVFNSFDIASDLRCDDA